MRRLVEMREAQEPGAPSAGAQPMFRSHSSELVVLPVTVTDRKGELIGRQPELRGPCRECDPGNCTGPLKVRNV